MSLSNNQVVGYVLISADTNPDLRDQTNREGLIENTAYADLTELVRSVLRLLEQRRYDARRPPSRPGKGGGIFEGFSLEAVRSYVSRNYGEDKRLLDLVGETAADLGRRIEEAQDVIARYRHLATLGQLIDTVLHDGRAPIAKIGHEAELGLRDIERNRNGSLVPRLRERMAAIHGQSDVLAVVFRRIEPFGGRRRGRPKRIAIEKIIADAFDVVQTEIDSLGVNVNLPRTENLVSVDPAELEEIILNLLQNSLWWLRSVPQDERKIAVRVRRRDDRLDIIFSDSGPGVSADASDRIFDPYFSTKPSGVGLGLTIAGEIAADYYGGELVLLDNGPLPGASFRVTLRRRI
jgi:C4-dicarboxylate-specific signal transduction histidine kinase